MSDEHFDLDGVVRNLKGAVEAYHERAFDSVLLARLDVSKIADSIDYRKGLAIVRELAERNPYIFHPAQNSGDPDDGDEDECFFCHEWRKEHAADCLWRRAKELYP